MSKKFTTKDTKDTKDTQGTKEEKLGVLGVMGTACPHFGGHCLPTLCFVV